VTLRNIDPRVNTKAILITRNLAAATGDVAYTGVGFKPSSILFLGAVQNAAGPLSLAFLDNSGVGRSINSNAAGQWIDEQYLYFRIDAANFQYAYLASYDNDGFTLTWVKTLLPTGTAAIVALCFR